MKNDGNKIMRIKELRKISGLTQQQLADSLGTARSAVAAWEVEAALPIARDLPRLAKVLSCSISDLFVSEQRRDPRGRTVYSNSALVCAARHFVAAHESACRDEPVDFGAICSGCPEYPACKANWLETAAPVFDAAGIQPRFVRE